MMQKSYACGLVVILLCLVKEQQSDPSKYDFLIYFAISFWTVKYFETLGNLSQLQKTLRKLQRM